MSLDTPPTIAYCIILSLNASGLNGSVFSAASNRPPVAASAIGVLVVIDLLRTALVREAFRGRTPTSESFKVELEEDEAFPASEALPPPTTAVCLNKSCDKIFRFL